MNKSITQNPFLYAHKYNLTTNNVFPHCAAILLITKMEKENFSSKNIGNLPHWKTIHSEYSLLNYTFGNEGDHPIYFKWDEISDLKIKYIDCIFEAVFKLNLDQFGMPGHEIPVLNFLNDKFQWIVYKLDNNNKIIEINGFSDDASNMIKIEGDVEDLKKYNHCNYQKDSTTASFKGQYLTISKNEAAPLLVKLTKKEVRAYMKTQECEEYFDNIDDPMSYFIAFDENDKAKPQDDQRELREIYKRNWWSYKNYFGAMPARNQNNFRIPFLKGKEMSFVGQFNESMFGGYDTYNFIFYDQKTRTVAIYQQMT